MGVYMVAAQYFLSKNERSFDALESVVGEFEVFSSDHEDLHVFVVVLDVVDHEDGASLPRAVSPEG